MLRKRKTLFSIFNYSSFHTCTVMLTLSGFYPEERCVYFFCQGLNPGDEEAADHVQMPMRIWRRFLQLCPNVCEHVWWRDSSAIWCMKVGGMSHDSLGCLIYIQTAEVKHFTSQIVISYLHIFPYKTYLPWNMFGVSVAISCSHSYEVTAAVYQTPRG